MTYHASIELMEGWWIGYVHELPGCFASERALTACQSALPAAIAAYSAWQASHGEPSTVADSDVAIDEIVRGWPATPEYEVNAFFAADRPPLDAADVERATRLLAWTRADLLAAVAGLAPAELARPIEDGWSIQKILLHVGGAEWWYLDRLDLAVPRDAVPADPFARLAAVREHTLATLPRLVGLDQLSCRESEIWSPRKALRRALWHERDHTEHIRRFPSMLASSGAGHGSA